jgi:hypothetical protein
MMKGVDFEDPAKVPNQGAHITSRKQSVYSKPMKPQWNDSLLCNYAQQSPIVCKEAVDQVNIIPDELPITMSGARTHEHIVFMLWARLRQMSA